jgi:LemA protein
MIYLIIPAVFIVLIILIYNGLIGKKNQVEYAFSSIDVMLKKRYDLIPNLVSTLQQMMEHEKDIFTSITELRTRAMSPSASNEERIDLNNQITRSLGSIMVAVENYPDIKSSSNFEQLQRSLNEVEEQISAARRTFNSAVTDFNNGIEMFPSSILANMMGYSRKEVLEIPQAERENPNVKDLFKS